MEDEGRTQTAAQWVHANSKHRKATRQVLTELAMFIDAGNDCPSHKDIVEITGLAKSTVQQALGELEKDGTIVSVKNGGKKVRGGKTNCYRLAHFTPERVPQESTPPESVPVKSIPDESVPPESILSFEPVEYAPVHVHAGSDAAGEKDLSLRAKAKEKDKKIPLPEKPGKETAPEKPEKPSREPTPEGQEWSDLITAIGEVFGAFKIEAINYANMLTGKAKKGLWGQCAFEVPVTAAELRTWWRWYKSKNPTVDRVKEPAKVYSSITEWRNAIKSRPPQPVQTDGIQRIKPVMLDSNTGMHRTIPESELEKLRPDWRVGVRR